MAKRAALPKVFGPKRSALPFGPGITAFPGERLMETPGDEMRGREHAIPKVILQRILEETGSEEWFDGGYDLNRICERCFIALPVAGCDCH